MSKRQSKQKQRQVGHISLEEAAYSEAKSIAARPFGTKGDGFIFRSEKGLENGSVPFCSLNKPVPSDLMAKSDMRLYENYN